MNKNQTESNNEYLKELFELKKDVREINKRIEFLEKTLRVETKNNYINYVGKLLHLYIYADDALFEEEGLKISLRSNAVEFLEWAKDHFSCTIITNRSIEVIQETFNTIYLDWLNEIQIVVKDINDNDIEKLIDPYKEFYIVSTETLKGKVFSSEDAYGIKRYIKLGKQPFSNIKEKLFAPLLKFTESKISPILLNKPSSMGNYVRLGNKECFYRNFTYGKQYKKGYICLTVESTKYSLYTSFTLQHYYKEYEFNDYNLFQTKGIEELVEKLGEVFDTIIPLMDTRDISGILSKYNIDTE